MGMTDDHKRLLELESKKGTLQYGQTLTVTPAVGSDLVLASKDLIRWVGDKTDVNAWRIYLAPWQPQNGIVVNPIIAAATYADPTPWAPPEPRTFDAFFPLPCYARIMWGSGGVQNVAYVDWPKRGCLIQASGSYIQVNAFVNTVSPGIFPENLPLLAATLAPEPGGGDSSVPATFTYPPAAAQIIPETGYFQNFQIPPFARSFVPVFDLIALIAAGGTIKIATQLAPAAIGSIPGNDRQTWQTPVAGVYEQLFDQNPFMVCGQQVGVVRIEITPLVIPPAEFGCMFLLDL